MRILGADDARLLDRRMLVHERFDFGRPYLVAGRVDHALQPIDDEEITVLVHPAEIAAAEEALAVRFDENLPGILRLVPVTQKYLRAVHDEPADSTGRHS